MTHFMEKKLNSLGLFHYIFIHVYIYVNLYLSYFNVYPICCFSLLLFSYIAVSLPF
jgi:hypothetical protein